MTDLEKARAESASKLVMSAEDMRCEINRLRGENASLMERFERDALEIDRLRTTVQRLKDEIAFMTASEFFRAPTEEPGAI